MSSLRSVAEKAGVPLLTAYNALSNVQAVDPDVVERVRAVAVAQSYALRVTIRDVALLAGVSVSTVSYVLNDSPLINVRTRRKVKSAIQALGYRPNSTARNLKASETRLIGYAWHKVQDVVQRNPILDRFLYEMAQAAESRGYHVLTFAQSGPHEEHSYTDLVRTSRVDAFVLSDTAYGDRRIARLQELGIPFACFGRASSDADFPYADDDGHRGVGLLVEHLLAQGHTEIAMLAWPEGIVVSDIRVQGYLDALASAGVQARPDLLIHTVNDVSHAALSAEQVLSRTPRPTAVICGSDIIAIGLRTYLENMGLRIGADLAVASYDDTPVAEALHLTSAHQRLDVIADTVVDLVVGKLRGTPPEEQHVLVPPTLVVRASSSTRLEAFSA